MIFNRYLRREISRPLLPILAILIALFGSYSAATFLSDAVNGLLPIDTIAELIGLKVLISLEVLIPVALYVSVVLAFGRLHSESEFTAAYALRLTPARVRRAVLVLSGSLALIVAALSLVVRPWAYQALHALSARAESMLNVNAMEAGTFYVGRHGSRVIFLGHRDGPHAPASDVFVQSWRGDQLQIIHARLAHELPRIGTDESRITMRDAHIYKIDLSNPQNDEILDASDFVVKSDTSGGPGPDNAAIVASSPRLAASNSAADVAELQWRLSTPLSTLLLGMLGIPMSRATPRQSRYTKLGIAMLLYVAYYMLCTSARTWVQHGAIGRFPGIWWVPGLLGMFLIAALYGPYRSPEVSGGRA